MINGVIIKKLNKYNDDRGWLAEFWRSDETDFWPAMAYASATKPGVIRGPHEHKEQSDCFVFLGPGNFELHLWDNRENSETKGEYMKVEAGADNSMMIIVPPGVVHGYKCVSEVDGLCINLPDKLYKGKGKKGEVDEVRWEDAKGSIYKIT